MHDFSFKKKHFVNEMNFNRRLYIQYKGSLLLCSIDRTGQEQSEFLKFKEPKNRFQGIISASICSLAGRMTTLFLLGS
jgi:hypothetical protein